MFRNRLSPAMGAAAIAALALPPFTGALQAAEIDLPNHSFELPATEFVDTRVDSWQKLPKPEWFQEGPGQTWDQLIGVFANTPPEDPAHKENIDGTQAVFLFALPQVGFFQDFNSIGGTDTEPGHEFDVTFDPGKSYTLTVGVVGGGGNMMEGVTLQLSLYYRDSGGNPVPVASTTVTHSAETFPTTTRFVDFKVSVPTVQPTDPWAGENIGIMLVSTVAQDLVGGYWDIDNVRLASSGDSGPGLEFTRTGSGLQLSWPSTSGNSYQLQTSENMVSWTDYGDPHTGTGETLSVEVPFAESDHVFFRLLETVPAD